MADSRILCRMRAVQAASVRSGHKYQSAGREINGTCRIVRLLPQEGAGRSPEDSSELQISLFSPLNSALTQNYENLFSNSFQKLQPAVIYIVEGPEKARGLERKHSIYFQDGHRKCRKGIPEFQKGTAFLPSTFSGKVTNSANTEKHRETQDSRKSLQGRNDGRLMYGACRRTSYSSGRRPCRHRTHWA